MPICHSCNTREATSICRRCKCTQYCSVKCARRHYHGARGRHVLPHRKECDALAETFNRDPASTEFVRRAYSAVISAEEAKKKRDRAAMFGSDSDDEEEPEAKKRRGDDAFVVESYSDDDAVPGVRQDAVMGGDSDDDDDDGGDEERMADRIEGIKSYMAMTAADRHLRQFKFTGEMTRGRSDERDNIIAATTAADVWLHEEVLNKKEGPNPWRKMTKPETEFVDWDVTGGATSAPPNQTRESTVFDTRFVNRDISATNIGFKPDNCAWFSRGDWVSANIFRKGKFSRPLDKRLVWAVHAPKNVYVINTVEEMDRFSALYGYGKGEPEIDWRRVKDSSPPGSGIKYAGIAINFSSGRRLAKSNKTHRTSSLWHDGWDVISLAVWDVDSAFNNEAAPIRIRHTANPPGVLPAHAATLDEELKNLGVFTTIARYPEVRKYIDNKFHREESARGASRIYYTRDTRYPNGLPEPSANLATWNNVEAPDRVAGDDLYYDFKKYTEEFLRVKNRDAIGYVQLVRKDRQLQSSVGEKTQFTLENQENLVKEKLANVLARIKDAIRKFANETKYVEDLYVRVTLVARTMEDTEEEALRLLVRKSKKNRELFDRLWVASGNNADIYISGLRLMEKTVQSFYDDEKMTFTKDEMKARAKILAHNIADNRLSTKDLIKLLNQEVFNRPSEFGLRPFSVDGTTMENFRILDR